MKKLLATLLASTMALSAMGALVACGGDEEKAELSDYYLVGVSAGSLFAGTPVDGWKPYGYKELNSETEEVELKGAATRKALPDKLWMRKTKKDGVYTITADFYTNDQFCICDAKAGDLSIADESGKTSAWDNQIKYVNSDGSVHGTENEYFGEAYSPFGKERNFGCLQNGKYEITYDSKAGEFEEGYVTFKRVGNAAPLPMPEKDVYIKGNVASLPNGWDHKFADSHKLEFNAAKKEFTIDLVVGETDVVAGSQKEFGLAMYDKDATTGDGTFMDTAYLGKSGNANNKWGSQGNFVCSEAGTYTITLKWDSAWIIDISVKA